MKEIRIPHIAILNGRLWFKDHQIDRIGFTGSQKGMTKRQAAVLDYILQKDQEFSHGDSRKRITT